MSNLIIDAASDKILFKIIDDDKSYTSDYPNSRENFDKFTLLLFNFLKEKHVDIKDLKNIFVNQGPGKFSSIRISIATAKALSFSNNFNLYGFSSDQIFNKNYDKVIDLFKKGHLIKDLIKPQY